MYQNTITLFNFHEATGLWYPSVFTGVDLGVNNSSRSTKDGKNNGDAVSVIIHCAADKTFTTADGTEKSYTGAKAYAKCENPTACITFKPECDFIYEGAWPDLEPLREEDYESGLYHALNDEYDGVYMISSAAYYGLLPHFEIGGR